MADTARPDDNQRLDNLTRGERTFTVPGYCLLEGFAALGEATTGLDLRRLSVRDVIRLRTLNSEYRIVLLDPVRGRVKVQGGSFFTEPTEAVIEGSSFGGALLKVGWIGIGLQLEFVYDPPAGRTQSLITSPVEMLFLERAGK